MARSTHDCSTQYSQGYIAGLDFALSMLENMQCTRVVDIPAAIAIIKEVKEQYRGARIITL